MRVVFVGGGIAGLGGATLLARDGHEVIVLERDPAPPVAPDAARDRWERRGVGQFRLPHGFLSRFRQVLDAELPDVAAALVDAGALRFNRVASLPASVTRGWWPGDERFEAITGRRPMVEATLAQIAAREPGVTVRRGVAVRGVLTKTDRCGPPHVSGVVTDTGEQVVADLVVDAGGRRSAMPDLLAAADIRRPSEQREDSGFTYYARHFRSADGSIPPAIGPPVQHHRTTSIATLAADNGHWSVVVYALSGDRPLRALRDVDVWTRVVAAYPAASWIDAEPTTGIDVMAAIEDRVRDYVVDDAPVCTGLVALGDAAACTSPSIGRGASIAMLHGVVLRDVLRRVPAEEPRQLVDTFHADSAAQVRPFVDDTLVIDRHRRAQIRAELAGAPYEPEDPGFTFGQRLLAGGRSDPTLLRAAGEVFGLLSRPIELARRRDIVERVAAVHTLPPPSGPDRDELMGLIGRR